MTTLNDIADTRLYWDDLVPGTVFKTGGRTITEADVGAFAGLTADFNRAHVDREFAQQTPFGQRIAHGMLVASVSVGLATRSLVHLLMEQTQIAVMENTIKFIKPTLINDTIHVEIEVLEQRQTRNPQRGVTIFQRVTKNQNDETLIESRVVYLMHTRAVSAEVLAS
ncbi:MaoC family dehydratase (plasmid) [Paraburkholderia sp. PGU19]|uniref:MaoC family dehydratase n=1 Tax=Paraburkholderia sp. PGU19 TaxID=2735434 RepID=UPI0015D9B5BB|nr:MaoC/PaaZ C-terminal domain-containing protein [Paraburkholderia sp. PGU19]BCG04449.1 MaoC family dehydratase [Paraburkholderia sp. PGU19]